MNSTDILRILCAQPGVSGDELIAADAASTLLSEYCSVNRDALGNVIGTTNGTGNRILLDAHIDQIGLIVTEVDKSGFIRFDKCGGADARLLSAAEVTIHGKEDVYGVICSTPPHLSNPDNKGKAPEIKSLAIDVGLDYEKSSELILPGDRVTFNGAYTEFLNGRVTSPSLDDRAGVAVILRTLDILKQRDCSANITVVFASREETGGSGAITAAFNSGAQAALAFDVSFADSPDVSSRMCKKLGSGAMIGAAPCLTRDITDTLLSIAKQHNINYTIEVMGSRTGTDADGITSVAGGIKTGLISIPLRNMHSAAEVIDIADIEACALLTAEFIIREAVTDA